MTISITEIHRYAKRAGANPEETREYMLFSEGESMDVVESTFISNLTSPLSNGLILDSTEVAIHPKRDATWNATATWVKAKKKEVPETSDEEVSFNISTQSVKITQAKEHINSYAPAGKDPPDHKGAIGVDGKEVKGCEILVPVINFTVTIYQPVATITNSYIHDLGGATGTTNDAAFRGWSTGEVLFVGCTGNPRNADDYQMAYSFAAAPNLSSFSLGDISGIAKKAWEYLWAEYEKKKDATANKIIMPPRAVHVERVYDETNFPSVIGVSA